jgi:CRP/FNR family transcriptional regulator, cyclic AMP receptor protein
VIFKFRKSQYAPEQDDVADTVFYIKKGKVKLTVLSDRREAVVAILERVQFFGEGCLNGESATIYSVFERSRYRFA